MPRLFVLAAVALAAAGCTSVAQLSNLGDASCAAVFEAQLGSILTEQGENPEVAGRLASRSLRALSSGSFGPRPFRVSSPSGTDYDFFVQAKDSACLLRLYGREKGFTSYTNNLTYIATRTLAGCSCTEGSVVRFGIATLEG